MDSKKIEEGDIVTVICANGEIMRDAVVRYTPSGDGDAWHFVSKDGRPFVVQRYESIFLTEKGKGYYQTEGG